LGDLDIDGTIIFNIKIDVGNIECEWIGTVHWWALVNTVMYLPLGLKSGKLLFTG
jgi:hypothetical protein